MKKPLKITLITLGAVFGTVVAFIGGVLIFASATTLKVKDVERMNVDGAVTANVNKANQRITGIRIQSKPIGSDHKITTISPQQNY